MNAAEIEARHRVAAAKTAAPHLFRGYLRAHPKYPDTIEAVLCKGCGTPIRGLVEDERFEDARRLDNGRVVLYKKLILATFANYAERTIEFDDGSQHVTNGCRACLDALSDDGLEPWYAADLAEWDREGAVRWDVVGRRKPVRLVRG